MAAVVFALPFMVSVGSLNGSSNLCVVLARLSFSNMRVMSPACAFSIMSLHFPLESMAHCDDIVSAAAVFRRAAAPCSRSSVRLTAFSGVLDQTVLSIKYSFQYTKQDQQYLVFLRRSEAAHRFTRNVAHSYLIPILHEAAVALLWSSPLLIVCFISRVFFESCIDSTVEGLSSCLKSSIVPFTMRG